MNTKKTETLLWTILVWTLSFLCYLPMLLDKNGVHVPEAAQSLKYFFVVMPLLISILFALKQKCLKNFFAGLFAEKIKFRSIFICAILVWAVWHIPMWAIRNSLGFKEIIIYFIYTVIISFILGIVFCEYKNILTVSLAHMIINTCYIAPVKYNVILLVCILFLSFFLLRKRIGTFGK